MIDPVFPVGATVRGRRGLVEHRSGWHLVDFPVRYGLFEHPSEGVVLVDTGYTEQLFRTPGFSMAAYRALLRPRLDPGNSPSARVAALGASASDVRHIILTHLHADHVCGIRAFPRARFHVSRASAEFLLRASRLERQRQALYPALLPPDFTERLRFVEDAPPRRLSDDLGYGHDVFGDGTCVAVALPGHMVGHIGVLWPERERPLLYGADVAWTLAGLHDPIPPAPLRWILADRADTRASARKLIRFAEQKGDIVLCHDPSTVDIGRPG